MKPERNFTLFRGIAFISLSLLPLGYVGSYCAVLALPVTVTAHRNDIHVVYVAINGEWDRYPDYHGLPEWLFTPVHDFDRTHLRPPFGAAPIPATKNCPSTGCLDRIQLQPNSNENSRNAEPCAAANCSVR